MPKRIYSLDVLRGTAIAIMLLVDAPPEKIYPLLEHAPWSGLTIADLAFPLFAFAMGTSAAISMSRRQSSTKKILRRVTILFALGVFLNVLPIIFTGGNFGDVRLFGVLQRLALTYAAAIFITRWISYDLGILVIAFTLLFVASLGFYAYTLENPFDEANNISGALDLIFPGANHIYTPTYDPEGLYGVIAGTASVLFGFLAGRILVGNVMTVEFNYIVLCMMGFGLMIVLGLWETKTLVLEKSIAAIVPVFCLMPFKYNAEANTYLDGDINEIARDKPAMLGITGAALVISGDIWSLLDIISKKLWTTPFALINAGIDLIFLALLVKFVDNSLVEKLFRPLAMLGRNPLFFFVANNVVLTILFAIPCGDTNFYLWLYQHTTRGFISPEFGATLFCVLWMSLWFPIAEIFCRRNIMIKL